MKLSQIIILSSIVFVTSCVPQRKYDELAGKYDDCQKKQEKSIKDIAALSEENKKLYAEQQALNDRIASLVIDSTECHAALEKTKKLYQELNTLQQRIIENNKIESDKMLIELNKRNEILKEKERELNEKESKLAEEKRRNQELELSLREREKRVVELESILRQKDSAVKSLRNNLANALLGFKDKGLTVEVKNGKVYVSLEEKLLFKSGSTDVDPKGKEALVALSKVLNDYKDVNIMVEGHTDTVPINTAKIRDNWDLSVLRATSIIRILTEDGKVAPQRLIAGGRSQYSPLSRNNTAEALRINRRTEIILTPKLDELFQILGN